jgi:hypothetical protein
VQASVVQGLRHVVQGLHYGQVGCFTVQSVTK